MTAPATGSAADSALVERFRQALDRLWPEGGRLGLAVSGGPDSLALLLLAEAAIPGRFEVATVDHGLRAESAGECAMVADECAARGITCAILNIEVARGNVQAEARRARYNALAEWTERRGLSAVATAHHADDQAETLLMRLNRGSGLAGLAGVREQGFIPFPGTALVRPLLGFRRSELAQVVSASGLEPVQDPSNEDDRYDRARMRRALAEADWIDPVALARSASLLGEAQRAIEQIVQESWMDRVFPEGEGFRYYPGSGSAYVDAEVVRAILTSMGGDPRRSDVARLIGRLHQGTAANLAGIMVRAEIEHAPDDPVPITKWVFASEPPRSVH